MATRRMITSSIWRDDWFGQLSFFDQTLWIGLFSMCADDQGRALDNPVLIRADVFPYKDIPTDEIDQALDRFERAGRIIRYIAGGKRLIQIVRWWEHQQPQWAQQSKYPAPDGWYDRIRTRIDGKYVEENWKDNPTDLEQVQVNYSGDNPSRDDQAGGQYPDPVPDPVPEKEGASPARDYLADVLEHSQKSDQAGVADPNQDGERWLNYKSQALKAYKELTGLYPDKQVGKPAIGNLAGEPDFDLQKWRSSIETCKLGGVNPRNIACMIDTYRAGGDYGEMLRQRKNGGKHGPNQGPGARTGRPGYRVAEPFDLAESERIKAEIHAGGAREGPEGAGGVP